MGWDGQDASWGVLGRGCLPMPCGLEVCRGLLLSLHPTAPGRGRVCGGACARARRGEGNAWRRGAATWSGPGAGICRGRSAAGKTKPRSPSPASTGAHAAGKMLSLSLLLWLVPMGQAAPKDGATRAEAEAGLDISSNPFQSGQEQFRLLLNYLKGLGQASGDLEQLSREQVLLYLFALHDFDQSGQLDGLELLAMLKEALFPGARASSSTGQVIKVVDKVLETQDLDRDGLVTPAELLTLPGDALRHREPQESSVPPPQDSELIGSPAMLAIKLLEQGTGEAMIQEGATGPEGEDRKAIDSGQETRSLVETIGIGEEDSMKATDLEQEAKSLGEATGPEEEDGRKDTDPEQEARSLGEAIGGPGEEVGYQSEAGEEVKGPLGEDGEAMEIIVADVGTLELEEHLEPRELPGEFGGHVIQPENDEM
ncbi:cell growth regulator with EF hand domain protein 1 [Trichosurus vulpecula]|uniref:cell growth regulator with EF hand domain protein 1 n=1 Tax=Trichosurus vulpecula TaxID=9337 RepID=UPI00186B243F|nr:cell growth regulator with EF hand domain protein 1 [Trichosurus vulpecula]